MLELSNRNRLAKMILAIILLAGLTIFFNHLLRFKDSYVLLLVEESSSAALLGWPSSWLDVPSAFLDTEERALCLSKKQNMAGVCLALQYTATSGGVQIADSIRFSRTGKAHLPLTKPLSLTGTSPQGEATELVDNGARVILGDLKVRKTGKDGTVRMDYGGQTICLEPHEVWHSLVVLTPEGQVALKEEDWQEGLTEAYARGYPFTRVVFANMGLWPKANVRWEP